MHLYVLARGQLDKLERWKNDLSARYYPYRHTSNLKDPPGRLQLGVRPIELLEITFPSECLDEVLSTVFPKTGRLNKIRFFFKKILGLEDIPEFKPNGEIFAPYVDVQGIGLKKDKWQCQKCKKLYDSKRLCCDGITFEFI